MKSVVGKQTANQKSGNFAFNQSENREIADIAKLRDQDHSAQQCLLWISRSNDRDIQNKSSKLRNDYLKYHWSTISGCTDIER